MEHKQPYKGDVIKDAKTAKDSLSNKIIKLIEEEKALTKEKIGSAIDRLKSHDDFNKLDADKQKILIKPFEDELTKLKDQRFVANLRETRVKVTGSLLEQQLNELVRLAKPPEVGDPPVHYRGINSIKVNFPKNELKTMADVDAYIEALKKELNELIEQNKRISL